MPAIEILFKIEGQAQLQAAIAGINASLDKMSKATQAAGTSSADSRISSEKKVAAETAKAAKAQEKSLLDSIKSAEKAFDKSEKEKTKIQKKELREREKDVENWLGDARRLNDEAARDFEKSEKKKTQIAQAEANKRKEDIKGIARAGGNLIGGAISRTMGVVGRAATGLALGGGFMIADALHQGIKEEAQVGTAVRAADYKGGQGTKEFDAAGRAAAIATGGKAEDMFAGMDAVIRQTGNLPAAVGLIKDLAKYSASTGAEMADLGTLAGITFTHMHGDIGKTNEAMRALVGQTKKGAIDMRDLGQYGGRLVASADLFQGGTVGNIETFGALAQIAKRRGGKITAAEATEGSARLFDEIERHQDKFKALEVETKGAGGKLAPVQEILLNTLEREGVTKEGDVLSLIPKLFGRQAGGVEVGLAASFLEGSKGKGDAASLAAGKAHALAEINQYRTPVTQEQIDADVTSKLAENQSKLNIAMETFHERMNAELLPMLPQLIQKFVELIPAIEHVIHFFTDGSLTSGLAKLIGAIFVAELSKGAISMGAKEGIAAIINQALGKGSENTALGKAGAVFTITAAAVALYVTGSMLIDALYKSGDDADKKIRKEIGDADNITSKVKAGLITPEAGKIEAQKLTGIIDGTKPESTLKTLGIGAAANLIPGGQIFAGASTIFNKVSGLEKVGGVTGAIEGAANYVTAGGVGRSFSKIAEDEAAKRASGALTQSLDELNAALSKTSTSLDSFNSSLGGGAPGGAPGGGWGNNPAPGHAP